MEDYTPSSSAEKDSSDDDEDEDKPKSSSTRASRAIIGNIAAEKPAEKKAPKMPSLAERIFQKKEDKPGNQELPPETEETDDAADEELPVDIEREPEVTEIAEPEPWDEGEITEDGEINLSRPRPAAPEARVETVMAEEAAEGSGVEAEPTYEESAPETFEFAGDDGGEVPPEMPERIEDDADEPALPTRSVPSMTDGGGHFGSPGQRAAREQNVQAADEDMNEAIYRATKRGQNRGVAAGLLGGLYLGHRGKKKLTKSFEKTVKDKDAEIKELKTNQAIVQERLGAMEATGRHISSSVAENAFTQPQTRPEVTAAASTSAESNATNNQEPFVRVESVPGGPLTSGFEALSAAGLVIGAETIRRQHNRRERVRYMVDQRGNMNILRSAEASEQQPTKEFLPEERPITEDLYTTPDGRRVEMSSWHRIEIDQKTGKVVSNPEVEYGEEFQRETRQEVLRSQRGRGGSGAAVQLSTIAGDSADSSQSAAQDTAVTGDPYAPVAPALPRVTTKDDDDDEGVDPLIWVIGTAFVVILFLFAVLR